MNSSLSPILFSLLLFVLIMCLYLVVIRNKLYVQRKTIIDILFAIIFGLLSYLSCNYLTFRYDILEFSMIFIIIFVLGLILDLRYCLIVLVMSMISLVFVVESHEEKIMLYIDSILLICSLTVALIAKRQLFKKTWPPVYSCFIFSFILTTIYMAVTYLLFGLNNINPTLNLATLRYIIKLAQNIFSLFVIFLILNVFFKKVDFDESNSLSNKVFKIFSIVAPIIFVVVSILVFYLYYLRSYSISDEPYTSNIIYAIIRTASASHVVVAIIVILLVLVQMTIRRTITNRLKIVNSKLKLITSGDYNVKFDDTSSTELKKLSESINATVDTLKEKIDDVKKRESDELELARKLQVAQLPVVDECNVAGKIYANNIPAEDIGGDFYDFFAITDEIEVFLMADVSGKGIPGAMYMMRAKNTLRNVLMNAENFDSAFTYANQLLCENNDTLMFVTCFAAVYNKISGKLKYINAGHNPPIMCKKKNDGYDIHYIDTEPNPILGIDKDSNYTSHRLQLGEGDSIFLYTDGITEARNINKEFYGYDRLLQCLKKNKEINTEKVCNDIIEDVNNFSNGTEQHDDITFLCFKYTGTHNHVIIEANVSNISTGRKLIDRFCKLYKLGDSFVRDFKVVYDEIFSNILKYAYNDTEGVIDFELNYVDKNAEMIFKDSGSEFDPVKYNSTDIDRKAEDKINGGMGIMFCKNIMDSMYYERSNNQNILKMYKKIK